VTHGEGGVDRPAHLVRAWRAFRNQPGPFVLASLLLFLEWALLELLVVALHRLGVVVNVLLHVGFLVVLCGTLLGLHRMARAALAGEAVSAGEALRELQRGGALFVATVIYLGVVAIGFVLLVVPGVYLAARWAFFAQILATEPGGPLAALRRSHDLTARCWPEVAMALGAALLVTLAGAAILGVGAFVGFPVALLSLASLYETIATRRSEAAPLPPTAPGGVRPVGT
jgi:hypothetical protein